MKATMISGDARDHNRYDCGGSPHRGGIFMDRFKKVYTQGAVNVVEIWVDTETGVNYLFHCSGPAGGLTPLLGEDGKPIVTQQNQP